MSVAVLLVVLAGALLHAIWNLIVKAGRDTRLTTAGICIAAGLIAAVALPFFPTPARASWPYLAASSVTEVLYGVLLAGAYRVGDLSHAYPLMRGTAPLLVAIGSGAFIGEQLSGATWIGVGLISCGIFSLVLDARAQGHSGVATQLALVNAVVISAYTTLDGLGVRASGHAFAYTLWLSVLVAVPWLLWGLARFRTHRLVSWRPLVTSAAIGGACTLGSYSLALWAMTRAPVAAVAAVRETAIVFGTVLGAVVLRERVTRVRALAALVIALGVWAIHAR